MPGTDEDDPRARRRDARRAQSRNDILDAAERVFAEHGTHGPIRQIASLSGFSAAAIYLFFENKDDLVGAVLRRRGDELVPILRDAAVGPGTPLERLHAVVDVAHGYFAERPHFRGMLRHLTGGPAIIGTKLQALTATAEDRFTEATNVLVDLVAQGQAAGEIRAGNPRGLAYLFMVLVNELVLQAERDVEDPLFTADELHGLIDGMLRP